MFPFSIPPPGLPDEKGRVQILNIHTAKMRQFNLLGSDVDVGELAAETKNYSGAELEGLVRAAQSTAMNRHIKVTITHTRTFLLAYVGGHFFFFSSTLTLQPTIVVCQGAVGTVGIVQLVIRQCASLRAEMSDNSRLGGGGGGGRERVTRTERERKLQPFLLCKPSVHVIALQ